MSRIVILASVLALAGSVLGNSAHAESGFGLGLFLGQPTGVTAKLDIAKTQAIEVKAAWDLTETVTKNGDGSASFVLHGNYLMWFPGVFVPAKGIDIPPFVGIGGEVSFIPDGPGFGIHIPLGVQYRFENAPIELSFEIALGMGLFPATEFIGSGGLGIRYRF